MRGRITESRRSVCPWSVTHCIVMMKQVWTAEGGSWLRVYIYPPRMTFRPFCPSISEMSPISTSTATELVDCLTYRPTGSEKRLALRDRPTTFLWMSKEQQLGLTLTGKGNGRRVNSCCRSLRNRFCDKITDHGRRRHSVHCSQMNCFSVQFGAGLQHRSFADQSTSGRPPTMRCS